MEEPMPEKAHKDHPAVAPSKDSRSTVKVELALKVREGVAAARKGKPMAFPTHRLRP